MATPKYTFDEPTYEPAPGKKKHHRRVHSRDSEGGGEDGDPLDGSGSLTYSAASSINSATGESTDSSFADILRVLDVQEGKEGTTTATHRPKSIKDERSVAAESLAYSTDAESHLPSLATDYESHLNGTRYLSTIPGQPSDQYSDGGAARASLPMDRVDEERMNSTMDSEDLLFSPAEHADSMKRRKDRKKRREQLAADKTPRTKNTKSHIAVESRQGTPPTARPPRRESLEAGSGTEDEDVWYAKWWMCLYFDSMMPKR